MVKTLAVLNLLVCVFYYDPGLFASVEALKPAADFQYADKLIIGLNAFFSLLLLFGVGTGKFRRKITETEKQLEASNELAASLKDSLNKTKDELAQQKKLAENTVSSQLYDKAKDELSKLKEASIKAVEDIQRITASEAKLEAEKKTLQGNLTVLKASNEELQKKADKLSAAESELKETKEKLASAEANLKGGRNSIPPAAYQILYLFQKEGRLIDMLKENIDDYDDETLGSAFRKLHGDLSGILKDRLIVEPVLQEEEGSEVTLDAIPPETVKVSGRIPEKGPYTGELIHKGWRLKECKLPELVEGWKGDVIAPAEIEI